MVHWQLTVVVVCVQVQLGHHTQILEEGVTG